MLMKGVKVENRPPRAGKKSDNGDDVSQLVMDDVFSQIASDANPIEVNLQTPDETALVRQNWEQLSLNQPPKISTASSLLYGAAPEVATIAPPPAPTPIFSTMQPVNSNFTGVFGGATLGNRSILVVTPRANTDVTSIVANLQNGEACIITLDGMSTADAQRRLDFLSGVVCAIGGTIRPLDNAKYVLTPSGLGVKS